MVTPELAVLILQKKILIIIKFNLNHRFEKANRYNKLLKSLQKYPIVLCFFQAFGKILLKLS